MKRYVATDQGGYMFITKAASEVLTNYSEFFPKEVFKEDGTIKYALPIDGGSQYVISDPDAMKAIMSMGFIPLEHLFWDTSFKDMDLIAKKAKLDYDTLHSLVTAALGGNSKLNPNDVLFVLGLEGILGKEIADEFVYEAQKSKACRKDHFERLCNCMDAQMSNYYTDMSLYAYVRGKEEQEQRKKDGPVKTLVKNAKNAFNERLGKKNKKD